MVDRSEHLGTRAVVEREGQERVRRRAPLPEDAHVRVPEPVDRLELVADEEDLGHGAGEEVDQLALEPVRVLELVDHDRAEAQLLALPDRVVVPEQVARPELEVLEVERRLAVLRGRVRAGEAAEQLLQELAVAQRELVERRLLDGLPRLLVGRRTLAAGAEATQIEQPVGRLRSLREGERLSRRGARCVGGVHVVGQAAGRDGELLEPLGEARPVAQLELERPPGGPERLVDRRQHPPEPGGAVRREQAQPRGIVAGAELVQARSRTPLRGSRAPGCRRARGSAGRARPRTDGPSEGGGRSRGSSRSRRRRASARGRGVRARRAARERGRAARPPRAPCR